ncbi:MAG: hypothetical protein MJZ31_02865 [Bacteroidales bacterium]|nr:hypothetical protein [Bacteroidales bacterium]
MGILDSALKYAMADKCPYKKRCPFLDGGFTHCHKVEQEVLDCKFFQQIDEEVQAERNAEYQAKRDERNRLEMEAEEKERRKHEEEEAAYTEYCNKLEKYLDEYDKECDAFLSECKRIANENLEISEKITNGDADEFLSALAINEKNIKEHSKFRYKSIAKIKHLCEESNQELPDDIKNVKESDPSSTLLILDKNHARVLEDVANNKFKDNEEIQNIYKAKKEEEERLAEEKAKKAAIKKAQKEEQRIKEEKAAEKRKEEAILKEAKHKKINKILWIVAGVLLAYLFFVADGWLGYIFGTLALILVLIIIFFVWATA